MYVEFNSQKANTCDNSFVMKRYRKILPKPTPPESKPYIEDDS
ncbi:hypothetical protein FOXB_10289 [Fusarium oxysporum f. sp. conglutinans Fo5176]|uniref:Uncharacterized protein n=1 Tax=Fusarium oxysporum (strain Fo5176) TaxID=660025 RepID=F9FV58_FUSOF|nr:hypothetical protein FOXB_10289 [Fusarium oxysporum f. sp. conglutinans Fo5176]